jgi:dihydropteroate synthase
MGILNVTPDSFSERGPLDPARAIETGRRMVAEGAAILDIGGESTRPGAEPVPPEEEQRRILPVIAALARDSVPISVDTRNASTMARALDAGASIINDVSALQHDPEAAGLIAERGCPVILMHMRGTPKTMNGLARYGDVAAEVLAELGARVASAEAAGIARDRIAIDPGFGFAKVGAQNRELLARLSLFVNLRCRIIAGMSRKRFVGEMAGVADAAARGPASLAVAMIALSQGATILRVHDVAATIQAVRVWQALAE